MHTSMKIKELVTLLRGAFGLLTEQWQMASGHTRDESFMVIRFDSTIKKGHLRRLHAMVEDLLDEEISQGDRV